MGLILSIETATTNCSVSISKEGKTIVLKEDYDKNYSHAERLHVYIDAVLKKAKISKNDIDAVAVSEGPGSYTGVRIGVSVAKGLASAGKLGLIGVPTLNILAASQPRSPGPLYTTFAAGRRRVGFARYRWREDGWHAESGVQVVSWEELAETLAVDSSSDLPAVVVGEIGPAGREALRPLFGRIEIPAPAWHLRRAGFLADIAWRRLRASQLDAPSALLPLYAR